MSCPEIELQDVINAMVVNAAVINEAGDILCVNQAWKDFGQNNQGVPSLINEGSSYISVVEMAARKGDSYSKVFYDNLTKVLNRTIDSFDLEYPCNSDNEERWFIASMREIKNTHSRCFLVAHKDISELVRRERQVMAAHRLEEIGRYTSGIAHDFNNLLGILRGNLDLVNIKGGLDTSAERCMRECSYAVDRGISLIRQLLAYARQQVLAPKTLELSDLLTEVITNIKIRKHLFHTGRDNKKDPDGIKY